MIMTNNETFGKPVKHDFGLKSQFWGEQHVNFSNEQEQQFYNYLDKIIQDTKDRLSKDFKEKIIASAKELICWKCIIDKEDKNSLSFKFIGFPLEHSGGLVNVYPVYLFVEGNVLYSYDYGYESPIKFSNILNYESFCVMMNIIQDTSGDGDIGFAIAPSNEIKNYIEDKQ